MWRPTPFTSMIAGTIPVGEFFSEANVEPILATPGQPAAKEDAIIEPA